jgi:hypothetical protein
MPGTRPRRRAMTVIPVDVHVFNDQRRRLVGVVVADAEHAQRPLGGHPIL